jgi:flavin reductase (DIM6/NTAB) family NADH-FMN oxidoreductase RutF
MSSVTPLSADTSIDPGALRQAFGTFVTGITVITTHDEDGTPRGMTANSFSSVSLDPPLLLVCVGKSALSYSAFAKSDHFAVNLLHEDQVAVSATFASKSPEKFQSIDYDSVHTGAPILSDCLTWFDCSVHQRVDAGDHLILIGQVRAFGSSPKLPLCFCRGRYANVKDPLPAEWPKSHGMINGYLIEADDGLLFLEDGKGGWTLPMAGKRKGEIQLQLAQGAMALVPADSFLYSVFDVDDSDAGYLIYRARLDGQFPLDQIPASMRFFPFAQLPYESIASSELRAVVRRYVRERDERRFSIYSGSKEGGRVAMIDGTERPWADFSNTLHTGREGL